MTKNILVLPGDGIGPEIVAEAVKVLGKLKADGLDISLEHGLVGGAAYDAKGHPLPEETLAQARRADAILLGAVGGPQYESLERPLRPEQGGPNYSCLPICVPRSSIPSSPRLRHSSPRWLRGWTS
jgi:3-isopropylmalate dehydrogenase